MNGLCQFLALHGGTLLLGSTGLLALGAAGIALVRSPIHRQRTGELTILALLIWLVLTCIPLPRFAVLERFGPRAPTLQTEGPVFSTPRVTQDSAEIDEIEPAHLLEGLSREPALPTLPPGVLVPKGNAPQAGADAVLETSIPPFFASAPNPGPPSDSASRAPWERQELFAIAYLIGAFGCMAWLMLGRLLLVLLVWSGTAPEPWLRRLVESLPNPARTGRVRLVISTHCRRAMSFGVWRPTIVLPGEACRPESSERLRHVLLHELAHVHKRDALGLGLFNLALPLVYWNPLYWWIRTPTRLTAELIADDWAAGHCDKEHYVRDLIALIKNYNRPRLRPLAGIGMFASRTQFYRRMKMLIERDKPLAAQCSKPWRVALSVLFLFTLALFTGTAGVRPSNAQASSEEPNIQASSENESQKSSEDAKAIIAKLRKERNALRKELQELKTLVEQVRKETKERLKQKEKETATYLTLAEKVITEREREQLDAEKQRSTLKLEIAKLKSHRAVTVKETDDLSSKARSGLFDFPQAQLEIVNLAITYADALETHALEAAKIARMRKFVETKVVTGSELQTAEIRFKAAERKTRMLRTIAEAALHAALQEAELLGEMLNATEAQYGAGKVGRSEVISIMIRQAQAKQRAEILGTIPKD